MINPREKSHVSCSRPQIASSPAEQKEITGVKRQIPFNFLLPGGHGFDGFQSRDPNKEGDDFSDREVGNRTAPPPFVPFVDK